MLKIAIVGAGSRGVHCFGKLINERKDCVIQAICDTNIVRGRIAAESLGCKAVYTSVEEMLQHEQLDAAVVTTPDAEHEKCAVALLNGGVNILIDKPLSPSLAGCRNVINAMEKSGKIAMMGFNLRHAPMLKQLKKLVDEGMFGRIVLLENREFYEGGRTYMARWNGKKSLSGGLWIHKGSHDFDVFNWLLNFPKPKKVSAFAGMNVFTPQNFPFEVENGIAPGPNCRDCHYGKNGACPDCTKHEAPEWGLEAQAVDGYVKDSCMYMSDLSVHDNGFAIVEYENGVRASHMECFTAGMSDRLYTVVGTLATAQASLGKREIVITKRWTKERITYEIPEIDGSHGGADPGLVASFVAAVKGEKVPQASLVEGMYSTAIAEAAELSREEDRTVFVEL